MVKVTTIKVHCSKGEAGITIVRVTIVNVCYSEGKPGLTIA